MNRIQKMADINTITRKIQILIDQENVKEVYKKLYEWQEITFRAYNYTASHLYFQENIKEFFYINDDVKLDLSKRTEEKPEGILNTSRTNTTYRLLSSKFKGDIPADILTNINSRLAKTFNAERKEYFSGKRSLRTYKRNVPIPFSKTSLIRIEPFENEKGKINYTFQLFGINFKTQFGKDLSGNQLIFERCLSGEYSFAGSSLLLDDKKIYLLLSVQFESKAVELDPEKTAIAKLDFNVPIILTIGKKKYEIGTKEGYVYRRLAIQGARHRLQKSLFYAKGGKGRKKKLHKLEDFENKERDFVQTILHSYSKKMIDLCLKNKVGKLILDPQNEETKKLEARIKEIKQDENLTKMEKRDLIEKSKFVISNWSYYGLTEKIKYKAKIVGIEVV